MNINEAKQEIKNTLLAYHRKDENGIYIYPLRQQRPVLLMGPPGIGKTAIMEQIASECGVGLVSYTMTHHTRQSAIGLPKIVRKQYGSEEVSVTEYTTSEIIASVYECMEKTGCREGILFIDEINCVSETLSPVMLQFLQNKKFGTHAVPEGWMIVAAGNPLEYNRAAREFDIVTMDRVRRIDIEPELACWMDYASDAGVHEAVLSYLRIRPDRFYVASSTAAEKVFVTARGWEDLSRLLQSYEDMGIIPGDSQMLQFLGEKRTAEEFAAYYRIFRKYGTDYGIDRILDGSMEKAEYEEKLSMARSGAFEERFTVVSLLLAGVLRSCGDYCHDEEQAADFEESLERVFRYLDEEQEIVPEHEPDPEKQPSGIPGYVEERLHILETRKKNDLLSLTEEQRERQRLPLFLEASEEIRSRHLNSPEEKKQLLTELLKDLQYKTEKTAAETGAVMDRAFAFCEAAFGREQEMILLVSGLARNHRSMHYLTGHENDSFLKFSEELL